MIQTFNINTGLVLEGGAMRGIFSAGIIDVLMENGFAFPALVGVSAGAAFGCNYKSNQPGRALRYNLRYCREPKYCSFRSLVKTGDIFGAEFCYHAIPEKLDPFAVNAFANNPMAFYVVCTDVETGKPHYQRIDRVEDDCYEWIRASASMPLVSRIVEVGGGKYLDGGVADSIPLAFAETICPRNMVVLTRPRDYVKEPTNMLLFRHSLRKYPHMLEAVRNRHVMYNAQRDYVFAQEKAGRALVLCPDAPLTIGRIEHQREKIQQTYDLGRQLAMSRLDEIRGFIEDGH